MASANRSTRREGCFSYTCAIQTSHRRTREIQCASVFYTRTFVPKIWFWKGGEEKKIQKFFYSESNTHIYHFENFIFLTKEISKQQPLMSQKLYEVWNKIKISLFWNQTFTNAYFPQWHNLQHQWKPLFALL